MHKKAFIMSVTVFIIIVATVILAFFATSVSSVVTINPAGALAAAFAAVIGFAWFIKNH